MSKNIVVTGTSRGIGYQLVKLFAEAGHKVVALSRNTKPIEDLNMDNVYSLSFDITNQDDVDKAAVYIGKKMSTVDVLIHNAGLLIAKPLALLSVKDFEDVYKVNVFGVAMLTKALVSLMSRKSHVVTVSSIGGVQGSIKFPGLAAYSSSKGAVITLSE